MAEYVWIGGTGAVSEREAFSFFLASPPGSAAVERERKSLTRFPCPLLPASLFSPPSSLLPLFSLFSLPPPQDLRCKSRTLDFIPKAPADLPKWNYDGSSCGQAPGDDSEVFLIPRAIYKDPFRGGDNILVLCDAYEPPKAGEEGELGRELGGAEREREGVGRSGERELGGTEREGKRERERAS